MKGRQEMQRQNWPAMLALSVFALFALGIAFYMVASGQSQTLVVAGAVMVLALGQLAAIIASSWRVARTDQRLKSHGESLRQLSQIDQVQTSRLDHVERQLAAVPGRELLAEMVNLRDGFQALAGTMAKPAPAPREKPVERPRAEAAPKSAPPPKPAPRERLELMLEPVIELSTGQTAHYRACVNMVDEEGHEVPHESLMAKADEGGMRGQLDAHLLKLALPVLRRLRLKHGAMRMLVPLGASTLARPADLSRVAELLQEEQDAAPGIVFEFNHEDLGGLDQSGIEGLAKLGRLGATMGLAHVSISGLDLPSLRQLGVRYLDVDAQAFDAGFGVSQSWTEFARYARAMQFQLIGGGVETSLEAAAANRLARFAYGPYFAPPRKVKQGAGFAQSGSETEAA
jgi:EAL domain-containing protein (putative c-di-GMP-specific phosphodiesterase class I)